jgi:ATP-dependent Clp protease ATP-binding subunit ClpA
MAAPTVASRSVFEHWTDKAMAVVVVAQQEAAAFGHPHIGTEHMVAGLLADPSSTAGETLARAGLTPQAVRADLASRPPADPPPGLLTFTADAKDVIRRTLVASLELHHRKIRTGHLLLGLARAPEGARLLVDHGLDLATVETAVLASLAARKRPEGGADA